MVRCWIAGFVAVVAGCSEPRWEWPVSTPDAEGMDGAMLEGARAYAFAPDRHTQGLVVTRHGKLVAEWYEEGRDATSYAASWSVGKSIASALVGIAIEDGKLPGVDMSLAETFPVWAGTPHADIRLEHVLHMATGLSWSEAYSLAEANTSDVVQLVLTTESPLEYVLAQPLEVAPGTRFNYSSGDALLLAGVIEHATGMSAGEYAEARLFGKLGIEGADWWRAKTGETLTYCCVDMTTRDFARIGLLYLRGGLWEGEQVLPADWVAKSLEPAPVYEGYGYMWWLEGRTDPELPSDLIMANGHDGQYIYIIPSLDLVVVRNGHYDKYPGAPVADPQLFARYPSDGLSEGAGTLPPASWSHAELLRPILASIRD